MKFTPKEQKLIQRLRKQDRQWRWARWLILVSGLLSAGLCAGWGYFVSLLVRGPATPMDSDGVFVFALIWTKCCMFFCIACWCLGMVAVNWHGDVNRMLLLKLLDEQEQKATGRDAAA